MPQVTRIGDSSHEALIRDPSPPSTAERLRRLDTRKESERG